jgi:CRISPR/Cas system-associated exonuclease Cas4 (RecB family)
MSSAEYHKVESPSSILTYMQCPRKYYYRYVRRLEQRPGVHLVLGGAVHSAIEAFHKFQPVDLCEETFFGSLHPGLMRHFIHEWKNNSATIERIGLRSWEESFYFRQGMVMLDNFYRHHMRMVRDVQYRSGLTFSEAFNTLRPKSEMKIYSERLGVVGVIDAVQDVDGKISIIDYKTSKKSELDEECMIQLSILALLYDERFGRSPDRVGIHFLRHGLRMLPVIPDVVEFGEKVCSRFRWVTDSDDISEYPQKKSGLCKYRTGQCDYYKNCMETSEWV